jgi:predicted ATPase/class 3 adenylate cyclase
VSAVVVRTLLVTDIERSTALLQRLGPRYGELLGRHRQLIRAAVAARGGTEHDTEGDSFLLAFGSATAALEAAVEAQIALLGEPWPDDAVVRVRMGLHAGEVADTAGGLVGLAVHHTARIADAGHGGQILVSDVVRRLSGELSGGIGLRRLGPVRLRDVGEIVLHEVMHPQLPGEYPPLRTEGGSQNNLPAPRTSLVGREREATIVHQILAEHRLVTLTGVGGCGKTRLALRVAAEEVGEDTDGVWLVELGGLAAPDDVPCALAMALGVCGRTDDAPLDASLAVLEGRRSLVVLDNCEHLLDAAARLVDEVLDRLPGCRVLATSRQPLGLHGEAVFEVPALPVPLPSADPGEVVAADAVRLFEARADLVAPGGFRVGPDDAATVAAIVRRLDGIPLAIELAAARMRALTAAEILSRLDDRFRLLTSGSRTGLAHHQTLRAAVDWSYRLLVPAEQTLLARLAVFHGGCDLAAVEAVAAGDPVGPGDELGLLAALHDKSLALVDHEGGTTRWHLPDTIREYALERLEEGGEAAVVRDRHAAHFAAVADAVDRGPVDGGLLAWLARFTGDDANLAAAVRWAAEHRPVDALRIVAGLGWPWGLLLAVPPGVVAPAHAAMVACGDDAPALRARASAWLVGCEFWTGQRPAAALSRLRAAVRLAEESGDPRAVASTAMALVYLGSFLGWGEITEQDVRAAVDAADATGDDWVRLVARLNLASVVPLGAMSQFARQALDLVTRHRLTELEPLLLGHLSLDAAQRGASEEALVLARAAAGKRHALPFLHRRLGTPLSFAEAEHGDPALAVALAEDNLEEARANGATPMDRAQAEARLAHALFLAGRRAEVRAHAEVALAQPGMERFFEIALAALALAAVERASGDLEAAASCVVPIVAAPGRTDAYWRAVAEVAAVALAAGRRQDAADLLATSDEGRATRGMPLPPALVPADAALHDALVGWTGRPLGHDAVRRITAELATGAMSSA